MSKSRHTILAGLIGRGISGSKSPHIHEREAAAIGLPLVYRIIDFDCLNYAEDRLEEILLVLQRIGFDGVNVTHPFKQQVLACLDKISEDAAAIGAVNTVIFRNGARAGFNTDWSGFRASVLRDLAGISLVNVALIGAGGAGAAVAYALLNMGVRKLTINDRDQAQARYLARRLNSLFPKQTVCAADGPKEALRDVDGIVHASPVGMLSHPGLPFDPAYLLPDMWLVDIVYFPIETELLKAARERGCRVLSGGGMVVQQAAQAFRLITDVEPSVSRMIQSF
jgi:shikimate dehydrogenase